MCLKIGEHLDIQISYKILWLRLSQILLFLEFLVFFFKGGCFLAIFMKNMVDPFGVINAYCFCSFIAYCNKLYPCYIHMHFVSRATTKFLMC